MTKFPESNTTISHRHTQASAYLKASQTDPVSLKLNCLRGNVFFGAALVSFSGGDSPEFTAPTNNPRIDILSINDSGTLVRTAGTEDASPTAPAVPAGEIPIAQVFNRVGQTSIKDEDDSSNGYIEKDLRPFVKAVKSPNIIQITSNDTYTPSAGLKMIEVEVQARGGDGGDTGSSTPSSSGSTAGSAGGYAKKTITAADLEENYAIDFGGGNLTFGSVVTCNNGSNGESNIPADSNSNGPSGGSATGGDINISGQNGGYQSNNDEKEPGGSSFLGIGGAAVRGRYNGLPGTGFGSGGSGGSGTSNSGGAGAPGIVIIKEHF